MTEQLKKCKPPKNGISKVIIINDNDMKAIKKEYGIPDDKFAPQNVIIEWAERNKEYFGL